MKYLFPTFFIQQLFFNSRAITQIKMQSVTLLTFDVDGTLVKSIKSNSIGQERTTHSKAFIHAIGKVFTDNDDFENIYSTPLEIIPERCYHGATDGLILLNTINHAFNIHPSKSSSRLQDLYMAMYKYFEKCSDDEICLSIQTLPGVINTLKSLANNEKAKGQIICGLVTGNVEGIARKKMRALGIYETGIFHEKANDQYWNGENDHTFLGGFGSDYCSCNIEDETRLFKDRGEQIVIAYKRALTLLNKNQKIVRVVHIGDAPNDILAAKWCYDEKKFSSDVIVSCIGVATGSYSANILDTFIGETIIGSYEPIILENGIADPNFINACGIIP